MTADPRVTETVLAALESRRSVRGFLSAPVERAVIERILAAASRSPSATNTQPWRVHVLTGAALARLCSRLRATRSEQAPEPAPEYEYYPAAWPEPYLGRRRALGWQLYALLGIARGDRVAARAWHDRNFEFFGAPVGMIFTLDRRLAIASYIDLGMFLQGVTTAARGFGLDSCAQAAFASYHAVIRDELALGADEVVVCGLALGRADPAAVANRMVTERVPVAEFARFLDR